MGIAIACDCSAPMPSRTCAINLQWSAFPGAERGQDWRTAEVCMATAIIILVSALCGVCGAGIAVAIAMVLWPESKTQTEV